MRGVGHGVRSFVTQIRALLAQPPTSPIRRTLALPLYLVRLCLQLGKRWAADKCPQIAASLAFQTALALVPILAVTSALLGAMGALDAQSALLDYLSTEVFPVVGADFMAHLLGLVQNVRKGALGPFGLAITIVIAYMVFHSVESVFRAIWGATRRRSFWSKFIVFYTLATLVPFLFGLSLYHMAHYWHVIGLRTGLPFGSIWLAFVLANKLLPSTPVKWRAAIAGATVSAVLFELGRALFAGYLQAVALDRYRGVYGSLAIIPIALFWMYVAWLIVLFGAECAHAAQNLRALEALDRRARGEPEDRVNALVALRLALAVATHQRSTGQAISPADLAARFDLSDEVVETLFRRLKANGLVLEVYGDTTGYLLARAPDQVLVLDLIAPFFPVDVPAGPSLPELDARLAKLRELGRHEVDGATLADLLPVMTAVPLRSEPEPVGA